MYFVDREKIEITLQYLDSQLSLFQSQEKWCTPLEKAALERISHMIIESILDVGNAMIDGFIMRDPGSYEDIVDILIDEKVVTNKIGSSLKLLISFRKPLVQDYLNIQHEILGEAYNQHMNSLKDFSPLVKNYLKNELGHVTAFKN